MTDRPDDLAPLADAARTVDRSPSTLRRWIRGGELTRHEGEALTPGASPPVLVSLSELHALVVRLGAEPAPPRPAPRPVTAPSGGLAAVRLEVTIAELRGELAVARVELAAARADGARLAAHVADLRDERDELRGRLAAAEAELAAARTLARVPWWRRLLTG